MKNGRSGGQLGTRICEHVWRRCTSFKNWSSFFLDIRAKCYSRAFFFLRREKRNWRIRKTPGVPIFIALRCDTSVLNEIGNEISETVHNRCLPYRADRTWDYIFQFPSSKSITIDTVISIARCIKGWFYNKFRVIFFRNISAAIQNFLLFSIMNYL